MIDNIIDRKSVILVIRQEAENFGCISCGLSLSHSLIFRLRDEDVFQVSCLECNCTYLMYRSSVESSKNYDLPILIYLKGGKIKKIIKKHPRFGIMAHGKNDLKPKSGGEYFGSRGGVKKTTNGICYKCGLPACFKLLSSVRCEQSGKRIVAMFDKGASLNFYESSPCNVTVSVCACRKHKHSLELIDAAARLMNGVITSDLVETS